MVHDAIKEFISYHKWLSSLGILFLSALVAYSQLSKGIAYFPLFLSLVVTILVFVLLNLIIVRQCVWKLLDDSSRDAGMIFALTNISFILLILILITSVVFMYLNI